MTARIPINERLDKYSEHLPCGCRIWTGGKVGEYGRIQLSEQGRKRNWLVHRLAWTLEHGPIPDGLDVLHECDMPACFEVSHLFLGTHQDNMDDMTRKGRRVLPYPGKGSRHHQSKLTEKQVQEIRILGATLNSVQLSARYPVSARHIRKILNGATRA